ncbi:MAG: hypothetical protein IH948_01430 [Bacteroidetes bacterium]|nr:hypothetical protein [Bacteroidota bacterium]
MSNKEDPGLFVDMLDSQKKKEVKNMLTTLRRFRDKPDVINDNEFDEICKMFSQLVYSPYHQLLEIIQTI